MQDLHVGSRTLLPQTQPANLYLDPLKHSQIEWRGMNKLASLIILEIHMYLYATKKAL